MIAGVGRVLGTLLLAVGMLAGFVLALAMMLYLVAYLCRLFPLVGRRYRWK